MHPEVEGEGKVVNSFSYTWDNPKRANLDILLMCCSTVQPCPDILFSREFKCVFHTYESMHEIQLPTEPR